MEAGRAASIALLVLACGMFLVSCVYLGAPDLLAAQWVGEPFQFCLAALGAASALGSTQRSPRVVLGLAVGLACCLPPAGVFALSRWPGGDDGGGMGWAFLVLPLSCALAGVAIALAFVVFRRGHSVS